MALTGDDFCTSARDAFYLIYRNQGRVAFTQGGKNSINSNISGCDFSNFECSLYRVSFHLNLFLYHA